MNLVVAAFVIAVLGTMIVSAVRRQRRVLDTLAAQIRNLRRTAMEQHTHAPAGADYAWPAGARPLYEAAAEELARGGYVVLGDLIEQNAQGKGVGVARWFTSADGLICGWFAALPSAQGLKTTRFLFSEGNDDNFFLTLSGPTSIRVAQPPSIHRAQVPIEQGLAAATAEQEKLIAGLRGSDGALRKVVTLDDATDLLARMRRTIQAWRAAQPADRLLTQDLELILGPRFLELGPKVLQRIRQAPN